jgi:hypothetical protein
MDAAMQKTARWVRFNFTEQLLYAGISIYFPGSAPVYLRRLKGAALAIDGSGNFTAYVYSPRRVAAGVEYHVFV